VTDDVTSLHYLWGAISL